jgi:hypothetical protein
MNEPPHPSNLGPSSLGEVLDRTAQLYRSRFLVFLGISVVPTALVLIPVCGIGLLLVWLGSAGAFSNDPARAGIVAVALFAAIGLMVPIVFAAMALAMAAMNHAVARAYLGEKTTIRDAYKAAWRRGWHYVWLLILEALIIGAAPMAVWAMLVATVAVGSAIAQQTGMGRIAGGTIFGLAAILALVALVCYFFWMLLRFSLAFPTCVIEEIGALAALNRSSALSKGTKGRIFLLYLLGTALTWLLSMGITVPMAMIMALIPASSGPRQAQIAATVLALIVYGSAFAVQALVRPVYGIALTLFYYDQRIRHEGFDIEWLMQRAGMVAQPPQSGEPPKSIEPPPTISKEIV